MDLRGLTPAELKERIAALGHPAYRAEQVFRWLHGPGAGGLGAVRDASAPCNVPAPLREALMVEGAPAALKLDVEQKAADGTRKFAFVTHDGRSIESVLIPDDNQERDRLTLCISSQVGCAIDCKFCATATLGFGRHLNAGEIVSQVYWASEVAGRRPTNIVFMGMGEPLHNFDHVRRAFELLCHPWGAGFSPRRVTISTAGLVSGIEKLALLTPVPNLAISLNASSNEIRDQIMPINKKWPIEQLMEAVKKFPLGHGRKITFEYVMLAGVNDGNVDADRLATLVANIPSMINLIPWNPFNGPQFQRPSTERVLAFQNRLRARGIQVYIRMPRGDDIDAACGQLAARAPGPRKDVDVSLLRALRTPAST